MSVDFKIRMDVSGVEDLAKNIDKITGRKLGMILRNSVTYSITPIVQTAKRMARVDTGTLKRSIVKKVKQYRETTVTGIVGPDASVKLLGAVSVRDGRVYRKTLRRPAFTAHLVEFGHRIAIGGKLTRIRRRKTGNVTVGGSGTSAGFVKPYPFMTPAIDATSSTVEDRLESKIGEGIRKALQ